MQLEDAEYLGHEGTQLVSKASIHENCLGLLWCDTLHFSVLSEKIVQYFFRASRTKHWNSEPLTTVKHFMIYSCLHL